MKSEGEGWKRCWLLVLKQQPSAFIMGRIHFLCLALAFTLLFLSQSVYLLIICHLL